MNMQHMQAAEVKAEVEVVEIQVSVLAFYERRERAIRLLRADGYFARFRENLATCTSARMAWIKTEGEMIEGLGVGRFSEFQSFVNALSWERKRRKQKSIRIYEPDQD